MTANSQSKFRLVPKTNPPFQHAELHPFMNSLFPPPAFVASLQVRLTATATSTFTTTTTTTTAACISSRASLFFARSRLAPAKVCAPKRPSVRRMIVNEAKGGRVLHVKASPDGGLGDCPFSWKANLALRFRGVEFEPSYVDTSNKPQWFLDLTDKGTTPVLVDGDTVLKDSADIVEAADRMGTGPTLIRKSDPNWDKAADVIDPIFSAFINLMKNKDEEQEKECKDKVVDAIQAVSAYIKSVDGPFLLGREVSALDCDLAPKAKNILMAAPSYKNVEFPDDCQPLKDYISHFETLAEWKRSAPSDDVIISAWSKFFK